MVYILCAHEGLTLPPVPLHMLQATAAPPSSPAHATPCAVPARWCSYLAALVPCLVIFDANVEQNDSS